MTGRPTAAQARARGGLRGLLAAVCFLTRLHISLAEVKTRTPEEDEIKQLETLYVTEQSLRDFIMRNHGNISATGEPNLLLYGELLYGKQWL